MRHFNSLSAIGIFSVSLLLVTCNAAGVVNIETVPVGNLGNAPDPATGSVYGRVDYAYNIGKYDVTSSQYTAFLNAVAQTDLYGVYHSVSQIPQTSGVASMASVTSGNPGIMQIGSSGSYTYTVAAGRGDYPVTDVTFWDACRFANWLANGQPTGPEGPGTTETGTYTLTPTGITNDTVTRNANATWAVTSENEWYKAAYYSQALNAGAGGYWLYPIQSNTISTTQANYTGGFGVVVGDTTPVGSYPYPSYYGTYDQGGNVWQWNESVYGPNRALRGSAWDNNDGQMRPVISQFWGPTDVNNDGGFRVSLVPEPGALSLLGFGGLAMLGRRRRAGACISNLVR